MKKFLQIISIVYTATISSATNLHCLQHSDSMPLQELLANQKLTLYFSRPEPDASYFEKRAAARMILDATHKARRSISIWCYGLNYPPLLQALLNAQARGVTIEIIGSPDQNYTAAEQLGLTIRIRRRSGLQHAKVIIIDDRTIITGTGNFTTSGLFHNHNLFVQIESSETKGKLLKKMLHDESLPPPGLNEIVSGVTLLAAPRGGRLIQNSLLSAILSARHTIRFMIFSHSDPTLTGALLLKAHSGVLVEGIYDNPYGKNDLPPDSQGKILNEKLGIAPGVIYLEGNEAEYESEPGVYHGGHLHHKTLIIDDQLVFTGSYNWSRAARNSNLELFLRINNWKEAAILNGEFERIKSNSTLLSRPALAPLINKTRLTLTKTLPPQLCYQGENPVHSLLLFSGRGNYFRAQLFEPSTISSSGCLDLAENDSISSGVSGYSTHLLLPTVQNSHPASYLINFDSPQSGGLLKSEGLPCEESVACRPLNIARASLSGGWIWLDGVAEKLTTIQLWHRNGMSEPLPLYPGGALFYSFAPIDSSGDSIAFITGVSGSRYLACMQSGSQFSGPPLYLLDAYQFQTGVNIKCSSLE